MGVPMNLKAMDPLGNAMLAYLDGDHDAELVVRRDDGVDDPMRVSVFFRDPSEFTEIEMTAIRHCSGHVLDVGAGSGFHSLVLQENGVAVTAIDISPVAVDVMTRRGVNDAKCADIFDFKDGPFDTVIMMGHGIGMVETIAGLDRLLDQVRPLVAPQGKLLFDSGDVRVTKDASHLAYHETNRKLGKYIGEIRLQIGFRGEFGPLCGWLHVDADKAAERAELAGWRLAVLCRSEGGQYLAELTKVSD